MRFSILGNGVLGAETPKAKRHWHHAYMKGFSCFLFSRFGCFSFLLIYPHRAQ